MELTRKRKVGNPFAEDVLQGPQIDAESQQKILKYIETANKQGAKLEIGGRKWGNEGFFVEPTIFSNVTDNMTIAQEEVIHFYYNQLSYGLSIILLVDFRSSAIDFEIQNS